MPIIPSIPIHTIHTNPYHSYQFIPFIPIHTIYINSHYPLTKHYKQQLKEGFLLIFKNCKKCANYNKCAQETKVVNNERKIMSSCHRPTTLKACPSPGLKHVYFTLVLHLKLLYQIAEFQWCHGHWSALSFVWLCRKTVPLGMLKRTNGQWCVLLDVLLFG